MSQKPNPPTTGITASHRFLPLLLLLFVGSGCAALIYEIVWFQLLQLLIGSSAVSLGVLLGTFMGGMCVGSLFLARVISARPHPLRVYAALELGIGVFGILVLLGLPFVGKIYLAVVGHGLPGVLLRAAFAAICLLPPTILMGATLPAISRWVENTPRGVSWLGFFYGGNTAGAVFGCLLAGFYLLRVHDVITATFVAVALNVTVAAIAFGLARFTPHEPPKDDAPDRRVRIPAGAWPVYVTIAISGMTALGAEVIWTRLLSLLLGATTYTFSIILAVFLIGIGLGSSVGAYIARQIERPRMALGVAQLSLVAAMAWTAWNIAQSIPYWPINPGLTSSPWFLFQLDLVRCVWAILPAACFWGASFPLALASVASKGQDPGRMVGGVYAANTVGAIVGSIGVAMVMIPWIGTQQSQRLLIALAAVSALLLLAPPALDAATTTVASDGESRRGRRFGGLGALAAAVVTAVLLAASVSDVPFELIAYGRQFPWRLNQVSEVYRGEGINASVGVSELPNGVRNYHNAGKVQASSEPQDMRLQRMLGHLTTLVPANPRRVLVIGFGAGVTAGAVSLDPRVERETIAEIEPLVPRVVATYFSDHNFNVARNPKVQIEIDDARHYLLTTKETFDAITSDPLDPWVKGAAALYTREFWELVKAHLNPGGVVTVFVQLYESNTEAVKSEIATFISAFPNGIVWGNTYNGGGYDLVLLGQAEPTRINVDELEQRLLTPEYAPMRQSLSEIGFYSVVDLLSTFAAQGPQLQRWLADAQINRDKNLRLQYLAGFGLNQYQQAAIYSEMLSYRQWPESLFTGSPERIQALRAALGGAP